MNRLIVPFLVVSSFALSSCALFPQPLPETQTEFVATGEINIHSQNAAFDAVRVRRAGANISKRTDGSWGGVMNGQAVDVSVTPKRISGVEINMVLEESGGEKGTVITGQFHGNILRFEIGPKQALVRSANHSFTLTRGADGTYGPQGELVLKGDAALPEPPWPQFALALLAAFAD